MIFCLCLVFKFQSEKFIKLKSLEIIYVVLVAFTSFDKNSYISIQHEHRRGQRQFSLYSVRQDIMYTLLWIFITICIGMNSYPYLHNKAHIRIFRICAFLVAILSLFICVLFYYDYEDIWHFETKWILLIPKAYSWNFIFAKPNAILSLWMKCLSVSGSETELTHSLNMHMKFYILEQ